MTPLVKLYLYKYCTVYSVHCHDYAMYCHAISNVGEYIARGQPNKQSDMVAQKTTEVCIGKTLNIYK